MQNQYIAIEFDIATNRKLRSYTGSKPLTKSRVGMKPVGDEIEHVERLGRPNEVKKNRTSKTMWWQA